MWLPAAALLVLLTAGCIADSPPPNLDPARATPAAITHLELMTPKIPITATDHRVNEYWVARDPTNGFRLAAGAMDGEDAAGGSGCPIFASDDGGRSWKDVTPTGFILPYGQGDPWVVFSSAGVLHANCMVLGGNETSGRALLLYSRSFDGGQTWDQVRPMPGSDRAMTFADSKGNLFYCVSVGSSVKVWKSPDEGQSWHPVEQPSIPITCGSFGEAPDGTLFIGYGFWSLGFVVSHDSGNSWELLGPEIRPRSHIFDNDACAAIQSLGGDLVAAYTCWVPLSLLPNAPMPLAHPSFAVSSQTGHIFVAAQNFSGGDATSARYVLDLRKSVDGGKSFEPLAVPAPPYPCASCHSSRPILAIDDANVIGLLWHRGNLTLKEETWFSASLDEGKSWLPAVLLSQQSLDQGPWSVQNLRPRPHTVITPAAAALNDPTGPNFPDRLVGGSTELTWSQRYQGADTATMTYSPEGFVAVWQDLSGDGTPQVWSRIVGLR